MAEHFAKVGNVSGLRHTINGRMLPQSRLLKGSEIEKKSSRYSNILAGKQINSQK